LIDACRLHDRVVPLFVWDPALVTPGGRARLAFLAGCVDRLRDSLGGRLVVRRGRPADEVAAVARECDARSVYVTADYGPYGRARDREVASTLDVDGCEFIAVGSPYAVDPGQLLSSDDQPFKVFTPFSKAWMRRGWTPPQAAPPSRALSDAGLPSHPDLEVAPVDAALPEPGERAAHRRLDAFARGGLHRYGHDRDRIDRDSTSGLSPYLRFGCLHPRQLLTEAGPLDPGHRRFTTELCWRDFYADVLHHRPDAARHAYRPEWRRMEVDDGPRADARFHAWIHGMTGYPIVDAGMRQLVAEGWLHNRVRMVVASFLVKDLHIDWTRGARWFMTNLVDGDLASNQLNWQWVAGSGNDAAPYFRVFNPVRQGRSFDPHGTYVRRWISELSGIPDERAHEPWKAGCPAGYPAPIVDHASERREALSRYKRMRSRAQSR